MQLLLLLGYLAGSNRQTGHPARVDALLSKWDGVDRRLPSLSDSCVKLNVASASNIAIFTAICLLSTGGSRDRGDSSR